MINKVETTYMSNRKIEKSIFLYSFSVIFCEDKNNTPNDTDEPQAHDVQQENKMQ